MIFFWRLLVGHSTMMILSFRMGGSSKGVWKKMKGWNRRSVNHIVSIFCLVSSTCKHISGVFCSVDLVFVALYGAAFSSNSSNSNNRIWNECSWLRFTTIKASQLTSTQWYLRSSPKHGLFPYWNGNYLNPRRQLESHSQSLTVGIPSSQKLISEEEVAYTPNS